MRDMVRLRALVITAAVVFGTAAPAAAQTPPPDSTPSTSPDTTPSTVPDTTPAGRPGPAAGLDPRHDPDDAGSGNQR